MRLSLMLTVLALVVALPALAQVQLPAPPDLNVPVMSTVDPGVGKAGDKFVANGEHLDDSAVAALFLTDGKNDTKLVITAQNATSITFSLPAGIKAGRFALMVLTKGKEPRYIEQPVKITVEVPGETPAT